MKSATLSAVSSLSHQQIAQLIAAMHAANWRATYRGIFTDAYLDHQVEADRLQYWQTWVSQFANGQGEIFLATVAGAPAGFLCIEIGPERSLGAYVGNLHVLPQLRGQGIGKLLLAAAAGWAQKLGETQLYLRVYEDNLQARQFYAHDGWHAVAREMYDLPDKSGVSAAVLKLIKPLR